MLYVVSTVCAVYCFICLFVSILCQYNIDIMTWVLNAGHWKILFFHFVETESLQILL